MADAMAWFEGGIDAALALAAHNGRPLFLYWGASWCPPCNRVKSELFTHAGVIASLQAMVAVQLDGDSPQAQALAARFKLRSYPTMVLFHPDGSELTRLPCELDGAMFSEALTAARFAGQSAAASLLAALDGVRAITTAEWTLLANYSWDTDEDVLLQGRDVGTTLATLSALALNAMQGEPAIFARQIEDAAIRLRLHALVAQSGQGADATTPAFLLSVFGDARRARANMDIFVNSGHQLVRAAPAQHAQLASALAAAAAHWSEDTTLSMPDRLSATRLQMRMARLGYAAPGMPERVRASVDAALAVVDGKYARHTLLNTAVSALNDAGLYADAEGLLQSELARSHSPFYFMLSLAASARRRGDGPGVLQWYEQAWRGAHGSATRIQWGVTYLCAVIDATPADEARIEKACALVTQDFNAASDAFQQRNLTQARKLKAKLAELPVRGPAVHALQHVLAGA
jgi:hypothetical protein